MYKVLWTPEQLKYALDGMHFRDKTVEIMSCVLVDGEGVGDSAKRFDVPRQQIHRAIKGLQDNLQERMVKDGKVLIQVFANESRVGLIRDIEFGEGD